MREPRLIRVVHYPGEPNDLGVVVREQVFTGSTRLPSRNGYFVLWLDGHDDEIHPSSGKLVGHAGKPKVVTVSRSFTECAEIYRRYLQAVAKSSAPEG